MGRTCSSRLACVSVHEQINSAHGMLARLRGVSSSSTCQTSTGVHSLLFENLWVCNRHGFVKLCLVPFFIEVFSSPSSAWRSIVYLTDLASRSLEAVVTEKLGGFSTGSGDFHLALRVGNDSCSTCLQA